MRLDFYSDILNGYNLLFFFKTSHSFKVTSKIELTINSCFANVPHLKQTKGKSLD